MGATPDLEMFRLYGVTITREDPSDKGCQVSSWHAA
jgi:hypothetical protein